MHVSNRMFALALAFIVSACQNNIGLRGDGLEIQPEEIDLVNLKIKGIEASEYFEKEVSVTGFMRPRSHRLYLRKFDAEENTYENCFDLFIDFAAVKRWNEGVEKVVLRGELVVFPFLPFSDAMYIKRGKKELVPECQYSYKAGNYLYFDVHEFTIIR